MSTTSVAKRIFREPRTGQADADIRVRDVITISSADVLTLAAGLQVQSCS
jgi:hypothetical protein